MLSLNQFLDDDNVFPVDDISSLLADVLNGDMTI